jgi:hypothetical protein
MTLRPIKRNLSDLPMHGFVAGHLAAPSTPEDGILHLTGDSTLNGRRRQKHPVERKTRLNAYAHYCFGFETGCILEGCK